MNHILIDSAKQGVAFRECAQHSVHLTGGILRHFQAFSTPEQNPALKVLSAPVHPQVTQTVETVEKVPFQKLIFEKWEGNIKKRLIFGAPHNILARFWMFFSLLWEIFLNIFCAKGFLTVSLGSRNNCL